MEHYTKLTITVVIVAALSASCADCLILEGHTETDFETDFAYVGRFVILPDTKGRMQFDIYTPIDDCCTKLVLFNGWSSQWPKLQAEGDGMTCHEKLDLIPYNQNTKIPLREGVNRCYRETDINGVEWLHCTTTQRRFGNTHAQWYYLTFMNCHYQRNTGINVTYRIHLTNGFEDGLTIEFSGDENTNLLVTFLCGIILAFFMTCGCICGVKLMARKMLHVTYRMWFVSLALHTLGVIIMTIGWYQFALDGYERETTEAVGHYFTSAGTICYAVLVILMSKGYTITRLRIRSIGIVKIFLFALWFSAGYFILYYIQGKADPRDVTNIYDTPATIGIVCLRLVATAWCIYGTFFTVKNYPDKITFYFTFTLVTTFWFLSEPVMIFLSNYALPLYCRAKWIHAVYLITIVYGHLVFLLLTRPSETNTYFPYHLSTNKVDALYDPEFDAQDRYRPTEETFTNFMAISEMTKDDTFDDELPKRRGAASMVFKGKGKPEGGFNIFLAIKERPQQDEEAVSQPQKPLATISASVSMTTMLDTPVQPPANTPVTYLKDHDLDVTISGYENDDWKETAVASLKKNNSNPNSVWADEATTTPTQQISYTPVTFLKPHDTALTASVSDDEGGTLQNILQLLDEAEEDTKASAAPTFSKYDPRPVTPPKDLPAAHRMDGDSTTCYPDRTLPSFAPKDPLDQTSDSRKAEYTVEPLEGNPALSGQHGMYGLIPSCESASSSEDEADQALPKKGVTEFKPIRLQLPANQDARKKKTLRPVEDEGCVAYVQRTSDCPVMLRPPRMNKEKRQNADARPVSIKDEADMLSVADNSTTRGSDRQTRQNADARPVSIKDEADLLSVADNSTTRGSDRQTGPVAYMQPAVDCPVKLRPPSMNKEKRQNADVKPVSIKDEADMLSVADNSTTRGSDRQTQQIAVVKPVVRQDDAALMPNDLDDDKPLRSSSREAASDRDADMPLKMERGRTKERRSARRTKLHRSTESPDDQPDQLTQRRRRQRKNREPTIDSVLDPTIDSVLDSINMSQRHKERKYPGTAHREESEVEQAPALPQKAGKHPRQARPHSTTEPREEGHSEKQAEMGKRRQRHHRSTEHSEENEVNEQPNAMEEEKAREERRRRRRLRKLRAAAQAKKEEAERLHRHQIDADGELAASEDVTREAYHKSAVLKANLNHGIDDGTTVVELL